MCCFDSVWCSIVIRMCAVSEKRHVAAICPNRIWLVWCFLLLINWGAFKVSPKLVPLPTKDRMCPNRIWLVWCFLLLINWGAFKVSPKLVPLPAKDRMCCFDSVWCSIVMEMTTNDQSYNGTWSRLVCSQWPCPVGCNFKVLMAASPESGSIV